VPRLAQGCADFGDAEFFITGSAVGAVDDVVQPGFNRATVCGADVRLIVGQFSFTEQALACEMVGKLLGGTGGFADVIETLPFPWAVAGTRILLLDGRVSSRLCGMIRSTPTVKPSSLIWGGLLALMPSR
jgi:hypothetical protein